MKNGTEPTWKSTFTFDTNEAFMIIKVKDKNCEWVEKEGLDTRLGKAEVSFVDAVLKGTKVEGYFSLKNEGKAAGKIYLTITPKK